MGPPARSSSSQSRVSGSRSARLLSPYVWGSVEGEVTGEVISCLQSAAVTDAAVCEFPLVELDFEAADTGAETVELCGRDPCLWGEGGGADWPW